MANENNPFSFLEGLIKKFQVSLRGIKIFSPDSHDIDNSIHNVYNIQVNFSQQAPNLTQQRMLNEAIQPLLEKNFHFRTDETEQKLQTIDAFQHTDNEMKHFVETAIPRKDRSLWLSALILRQEFELRHNEVVAKIRADLVGQSNHARNITNLCTSYYLESMIKPLYEFYVEANHDQQKFEKVYENIISEMPFAVFISAEHDQDFFITEIEGKLHSISTSGYDRLYIHAIGPSNVKKAKQVAGCIVERHSDLVEKSVPESTSAAHFKITLYLKKTFQ